MRTTHAAGGARPNREKFDDLVLNIAREPWHEADISQNPLRNRFSAATAKAFVSASMATTFREGRSRQAIKANMPTLHPTSKNTEERAIGTPVQAVLQSASSSMECSREAISSPSAREST